MISSKFFPFSEQLARMDKRLRLLVGGILILSIVGCDSPIQKIEKEPEKIRVNLNFKRGN